MIVTDDFGDDAVWYHDMNVALGLSWQQYISQSTFFFHPWALDENSKQIL